MNRFASLPVSLVAGLSFAILVSAGCASIPQPSENPPFEKHLATKQKDNVEVSVAVLTDTEAEDYFRCPLGKQGIQAVWLKVHNQNNYPIGLLSHSMDPQYYSPHEVAFRNHHAFSDDWNHQLDDFFHQSQFPVFVDGGETETGFVWTSRTEGAKYVNVEFWHGKGLMRTGFFMRLPDGGFDFQESDFGKAYSANKVKSLDLSELRKLLEGLPCCTTNQEETKAGDPANFVMIGSEDTVMGALTQQGWDPTQTIGTQSVGKTVNAFLFGGQYRYSPVSPLFYFSRSQDLALQKVRSTIHQRNHLRLWRTPYLFQGQEVWVGQISRDIGVRFTFSSPILVTHKIDPEVDEARDYLVQDMISSGFLQSMGYLRGVGAAAAGSGRQNLTGDPYFTDGLRAVMFISSTPVRENEITLIDWGEGLPTD
jgi:hypothetical protein